MRYNADNDTVELSVRELCGAAFTVGSLDCAARGGDICERGALGSAIHKRIQSSYKQGYHSEVALRNTSKLDDLYYFVSGRADGIICKDGVYTVDEIKTVSGKHFAMPDKGIHVAQLFCYAYMFCRTKDLDGVNTRLTYYSTDDGEIRYSDRYMSCEELRRYYMGLLSAVSFRAGLLREKYRDRMPSAARAVFPYKELRETQREMIKECYLDIKHGCRLFCQAPTGIGKTISTLYPSVRAMGEGAADKIFYLTSKASIRREAFSAAEKLRTSGARLRTCVITAKEQICLCGAKRYSRVSSNCRPDVCPYAVGYYDKRELALSELVSTFHEYSRERIEETARKYMICPYELSLDLSELCDIIICDYNYVFSPLVYLRRYFDGDEREKYIFLVDEAHDLPDRARDMFSARISARDFYSLEDRLSAYGSEHAKLCSACGKIGERFERLRLICGETVRKDGEGREIGYCLSRKLPEGITEALLAFLKVCDAWLRQNEESELYSTVEELSMKLHELEKISECYDERYVTFINVCGENTTLLVYCLDPSAMLSAALERAVATVMFSATLTPAEYFAEILGGGERAVSVSFPSPFPPENLCLAAVDSISTRFEDRERSYRAISSCIAATVSARSGNYIAFFPSYNYMEQVYKIFHAKYPKVKTVVQSRGMNPSDKEGFLDFFKEDDKLRIGFCVLGGSFSEGIDLPGKRLIGTMIVGVGLPGISDERNIIRDYYEEKSVGSGYDYSYVYPGMNSVLQAVGRVIRRQDDKGIAVLIDDRYADAKYRALFPKEWKRVKYAGNPASLAELARRFWNDGE